MFKSRRTIVKDMKRLDDLEKQVVIQVEMITNLQASVTYLTKHAINLNELVEKHGEVLQFLVKSQEWAGIGDAFKEDATKH